MLKGFIAKLQLSIMGGAIIIGSASVLSRILGLVRDRLLSTTIGPGELLDSYFTAFKIPDFIFNIFVLGVMSASFVPVFIEHLTQKGKSDAMRMANSVLNLLLLSLIVIAAGCFLFAPQIIDLIAIGDTATQQAQTVQYTRLMLISLLFFGVSNVLSGLLHAYKKFFSYALAPILYNVGIIIGIVVFYPMYGGLGLPFGVILGSVMHFCVMLPGALRAGFSYKPMLDLKDAGVRQILKLMPPRAFALGLTQLNIVILFAIASTMDEGTRSIWQFADNLQHFPINIFGVSLALAAFPVFSEAFAKNDEDRFKRAFSESFRRVLFFIIPVSIATLLLRAQIVRLVYGAGEFDWTDTILTAQTLGMFALSMFAQAAVPLLARAFFAKQDTKTPVIISTVAMAINIGLAFLFAPSMGVVGLALAFSIAALIQMITYLVLLRLRHGDLQDELLIASTWKIIIASLGMGLVIQGVKYIVAPFVDMQTFIGIFLQTVSAIVAGGVAYLAIAARFRFKEAITIMEKAKRMWETAISS